SAGGRPAIQTIDPRLLRIRHREVVLDVGAGDGRHMLEWSRHPYRLIAFDISRNDLKRGKYMQGMMSWKHEQRGHVSWIEGDGNHLPFPDDSIDRIICTEVLEHVGDYRQLLAELLRVLKPGGSVAFSVPTPHTERVYWALSWEYWHSEGGHVRIFTPRRLRREIAEAGFKITGMRFKHSFHAPYWVLRCIFGVDNERSFLTRMYFRVLNLTIVRRSWLMVSLEALTDFVFPKSAVVYARKPGRHTGG
ncbi:MAG: methyltransferase domain-containing protein, partial [Dehalococcoidia bacterium]|nr:methyltransferase domain-containing protein [Dehalococcoidia bacterium]